MRVNRLLFALLVPLLLLVVGTFGFQVIEGWSTFDAFYMTVITLTTIGFGEVHPLSTVGRGFTAFLALGGIFTLFFAATEALRAIVSGELRTFLGVRRMERNLAKMSNHLIVCGYGRMGRLVTEQLAATGLPLVVIERTPTGLAELASSNVLALVGDATHDEVLQRAGVERARALVTVVGSDADNLYITMSARVLSEKLFIVARAEDERAEQKLKRAGASRVVAPFAIGGHLVARAVLHPTVLDFIELATRAQDLALQMEEAVIGAQSRLAGKTLRGSGIKEDAGALVVAFKREGGPMVFNPASEQLLAPGDVLVALGHREQLARFEKLARG